MTHPQVRPDPAFGLLKLYDDALPHVYGYLLASCGATSSGDQVHYRLSRAGNRQINRTRHIMAVVQLRNPPKAAPATTAKSPSARHP